MDRVAAILKSDRDHSHHVKYFGTSARFMELHLDLTIDCE